MWGAVAGAVAGQALGSLMQGGANYYFSKELAKLQFEHQKKMMQNAHQWEVEDLRKAGLNPILSAGGSGATGSASAPVVSAHGDNPVSSAIGMRTALEQQQLIKDQQQKTRADTLASQALASQYSASALQMKENARSLKRTNDYFDEHPEIFSAGQTNQALPGLKSIPGLLQLINTGPTQGSLKHMPSKKFEENIGRGID